MTAFEGHRVYVRAGWAARWDDPTALLAAAEGLLGVVADVLPALSTWAGPGRDAGPGMSPSEIVADVLARRPHGQSSAFRLSVSAVGQMAAGLSVSAGPPGEGEPHGGVSFWWEPGVASCPDETGEAASLIFSQMVDAWSADWVAAFPHEMARLQLPDWSNFVVGVLTYVRATPADVPVPGGGSMSPHALGSVFDLRGVDDTDLVRSAGLLRGALERSGAAHVIGAREGGSVTEHEAYLAMVDYLVSYALRAGNDLRDLFGDMQPAADGGSTDPAVWQDWLESVDRIRAGHSPGSWRAARRHGGSLPW